jgi:alpha-tubulin suppressor-like RCC1 family protein
MRAIALSSLLLLAACGDGLYDAAGLPAVDGNGLTCGVNTAACVDPQDSQLKCLPEVVERCGKACQDCAGTAHPAGSEVTCVLGRAPDGHGQCGYACADGYLACSNDQCCGATAVAASDGSSYALLSDGTVRAWGANDSGQVGDGTLTQRTTPAPVLLPTTATALGAGSDHACAVLAGGAVRCWGNNTNGQVTGTSTSASVSTPAATPVTSGAVAVAVGASHTCALLGTGTVTCWGSNLVGQTIGAAGITGATAIAAGRRHTCVVAGGAVKCWGDNALGQLGGTPSGGVATPIASGIQHLAAYADHTCAATESPTGDKIVDAVRCWGDVLGAAFQLASPQTTPAIPMKDSQQSTIRKAVTALSTGRSHVCVHTADGLQCFGTDNAAGQLGGVPTGATEPATVPATGATAFVAGADHNCAILANGALRCWGKNDRGQLGDGTVATPAVGTIVTPLGT